MANTLIYFFFVVTFYNFVRINKTTQTTFVEYFTGVDMIGKATVLDETGLETDNSRKITIELDYTHFLTPTGWMNIIQIVRSYINHFIKNWC